MTRYHTKVKIGYVNWKTNLKSCRFDNMCTSFYEITDIATDDDEKFCMLIEMINYMKKKMKPERKLIPKQ